MRLCFIFCPRQELQVFYRGVHVESGEIVVSFDVSSLFTNVPVGEAVSVIRERLRQYCNSQQHASSCLCLPLLANLIHHQFFFTCFQYHTLGRERQVNLGRFSCAMQEFECCQLDCSTDTVSYPVPAVKLSLDIASYPGRSQEKQPGNLPGFKLYTDMTAKRLQFAP